MPSNEFQALQKRGGKDYSVGHQIMYLTPITLLRGTQRDILDVGFGIGWGLRQMLREKVIRSYVGFEPDCDSFNYVTRELPVNSKCQLHDLPWGTAESTMAVLGRKFEHALCIEVIEHVPLERHQMFLAQIRAHLPEGATLWISTPDVSKHSHGVRTKREYWQLLRDAGFSNVITHEEQWTTLYVCQ